MIQTISSKNIITKMGKENKPVFFLESGESVKLETLDCFGNRFYTETKDFDKIRGYNPATGPIYVNDAKAGDTLKVTIEKIELGEKAVIEFRYKSGILGERVEEFDYKIIKMDTECAYLDDLKLPLKPMIGVIGVAPRGEAISTVVPDSHGGNMDCNEIKENSVLYLPIYQDGALLSLGDLHGLMGDGEVGNCGLEAYGTVQIKIQVLKNFKITNPLVVADDKLFALGSDESLDEAIKMVSNDLVDLLVKYERFKAIDAIRLISMIGDLGICQVVNPKKTVKMSLPLSILKNHVFK